MKATKMLTVSILFLSGCSSYQPLLVPSDHPASVEQRATVPTWNGPDSLTPTETQVKEDENEMPNGSGHNHIHGGHQR